MSGDDLKVLSFLGQKHFLILRDAHISGDGINSLKLLKNLGGLDLKGTKFTDSEVKELIEALPKCLVSSDNVSSRPWLLK